MGSPRQDLPARDRPGKRQDLREGMDRLFQEEIGGPAEHPMLYLSGRELFERHGVGAGKAGQRPATATLHHLGKFGEGRMKEEIVIDIERRRTGCPGGLGKLLGAFDFRRHRLFQQNRQAA